MRWLAPLFVLASAAVLAGCNSDAMMTEGESENLRQEFSEENFEKAMIESGRQAELEEHKAREAAHMEGGNFDQSQ